MALPKPRIQPIIHHSVYIKNSFTYQDFLRTRPRHAFNFKFAKIRIPKRLPQTDEREVQHKLLRALKILKPITKVDLAKFEIADSYSWRTTFPSAFKKISHIKTLSLMKPQNHSEENHFRHFVTLKNLVYQLDGYSLFPSPRSSYIMLQDPPLKYLKYCPKVHSLKVLDYSSNAPIKLPHSLKSLESFHFMGQNFEHLPIENYKNLKSLSFNTHGPSAEEMIIKNLQAASRLLNLQEMNLRVSFDVGSRLTEAFEKIAQKGVLKKINLSFDNEFPQNFSKILEAFKDSNLTSFSLNTVIQQVQVFQTISKFIQNMSQLEFLELCLWKHDLFSKNDNLVEICKQINKLQALRSMKLSFSTSKKVSNSTNLPNLIPCLCDLFTKPVKIETLRLECNQIDSSEALQSLVSILGNSTALITNFKIDFGKLPGTKKTYQLILKLMKNLPNIQVFEIPCLDFHVSTSEFLLDIAEAASKLRYLRIFALGEIKKEVAMQTIYRIVETISSQKGLRRFSCGASHGEMEDMRKQAEMINFKRVVERNPYLESLDLWDGLLNMISIIKIYKWD